MDGTSVESDLAEVHRLLSLTRSAVVRDRLHALLNEFLQKKHQLLGGDSKDLSGGHSAATSSSALLTADFARNTYVSGTNQTAAAAGGCSMALHPLRGSLTDTGDTRSSNSGGNTPVEPIASSSLTLRGGQQDAAISPFDPVWQPGGKARAALPLGNGNFGLSQDQLGQQPSQSAAGQGLSGINRFAMPQNMSAMDGFAVPQHMRNSLASAHMQQPAQQDLPSSSQIGTANGYKRPYNVNPPPRQQQGAFDGLMVGGVDAAALAGANMLGGTYGDFGGVNTSVSLSALAAGTHFGNGDLLAYSRQQRNFGGGSNGVFYGGHAAKNGFGGGALRTYGNDNPPYGNAGPYNSPPAQGPFGAGVHPALQYGIDLRSGELDAMGMPLFRPLTTFSWEQSDGLIKIYVPLRGVQTDLLRATFTPTSVEVRVVALQGKNYVYAVKNTYYPINPDGCHVAASKTKKNVLITLQKLHGSSPDEKHWRDLSAN